MIGTTLSHYRILDHLGSGGMGDVYRARDERLEREVAIKVLPAGALADETVRRRFRKEALALSKLNHPNIATVHDFDSDQGIDFMVMELVPGRTLSEGLADGALPEGEIVRLGEQLAEGLAAAHHAGILHRDIKPGNLKVTLEGRLKILDFGLAKLTQPTGDLSTTAPLTVEGQVVGTLPYMSPEQVRGEMLNATGDVYSTGAVLYEMACGCRAFPQETATEVIGAILYRTPTAPRRLRPTISAELERIILRCLEKEPRKRYASAKDLDADLKGVATASDGPRRARGLFESRAAKVVALVVGAVVVASAAGLIAVQVGWLRGRNLGGGVVALKSLTVLPLVNLTGDPDQEYLADGMTEELINRLAQVGALRVISRSSAMHYKGSKMSLPDIARELDVDLVVEGSVGRSGDMVKVSAQLIDALKDRHVWAKSYERTWSNVLALQNDVARAIVENVRVRVTPKERERLGRAPSVDPAAHQAYLRGRFAFSQLSGESYRRAVDFYQKAIQIDPGYAPAYAGLADAYSMLSGNYLPTDEAMPRASSAAAKALELDPELASAHAALGYIKMFYEWDWTGAEAEFRRALEVNPGEVGGLQNYGALLVALGRFDEASQHLARAREIDPLSPWVASMSLWPLFEGRQFDRAVTEARKLSEADPKVFLPHLILGQALLFQGEHAAAIAEIKEAMRLDPTNPFSVGWLGYAYAVSGDRAKAVAVLESLREWSKKSPVQPYLFLMVHVGLGEKEKALDWLEKALAERSDELFFLKVDPALDPLRSEPRFQAVYKRMGFPA